MKIPFARFPILARALRQVYSPILAAPVNAKFRPGIAGSGLLLLLMLLCLGGGDDLLLNVARDRAVVGQLHGVRALPPGNRPELAVVLHDLSQWGLVNAVTRYSQDVDNYDRATELETLGGKIVDLKPTEWQPIAEAA